MKKIMTAALGLSFLAGSLAVAQNTSNTMSGDSTMKSGKKHGGKHKGGKSSTNTSSTSGTSK